MLTRIRCSSKLHCGGACHLIEARFGDVVSHRIGERNLRMRRTDDDNAAAVALFDHLFATGSQTVKRTHQRDVERSPKSFEVGREKRFSITVDRTRNEAVDPAQLRDRFA